MPRSLSSKLMRLCLFAVGLSAGSEAQTVRPLVAELGNPAKGRVEYVNDGLTPLNVVLTVKSFTVSETGEISYRALDPKVHLKLSTTSLRIQPQQSYFVFYEATSEVAPAWFVNLCKFFWFSISYAARFDCPLVTSAYRVPPSQAIARQITSSR